MFQKDKHNLVRLHKKKLNIKTFTNTCDTYKVMHNHESKNQISSEMVKEKQTSHFEDS